MIIWELGGRTPKDQIVGKQKTKKKKNDNLFLVTFVRN